MDKCTAATISSIFSSISELITCDSISDQSCWEFLDFIPKCFESAAKVDNPADRDVQIKRFLEAEWHPLAVAKFTSVLKDVDISTQQYNQAIEKIGGFVLVVCFDLL
jgi:hypothetical protein